MMGLGVPGRFVTSTMETWRCQKPLLVRAVLFRICVLFSWRYRLSHWGFWEIDNLMSLFVSIFFPIYASFFGCWGIPESPTSWEKKTVGTYPPMPLTLTLLRSGWMPLMRSWSPGWISEGSCFEPSLSTWSRSKLAVKLRICNSYKLRDHHLGGPFLGSFSHSLPSPGFFTLIFSWSRCKRAILRLVA